MTGAMTSSEKMITGRRIVTTSSRIARFLDRNRALPYLALTRTPDERVADETRRNRCARAGAFARADRRVRAQPRHASVPAVQVAVPQLRPVLPHGRLL